MVIDVIMPSQGLTITEATLIRWVKQPGDFVKADELLFEIETDKAAVEVESTVSGWLLACIATEGDVVPFGQIVGKIGTEETDTIEAATEEVSEPPILTKSETQILELETPVSVPMPSDVSENTRPVASPRARRAAEQLGVDLRSVTATGRRGMHIRECDVLLAAEQKPKEQKSVEQKPITAIPLSRLRRITAQRTTASFRDVPHFYLTREISAERLLSLRSEIVKDVEKHAGVRITVTDFLLRAVATALTAFPSVNTQWNGDSITSQSTLDVGLAVDTPDGLIVPVLRDVNALSLVEIAKRRFELVARARSGQSRPEDLTGGSFTLSNIGASGVDQFDAIINAPQSGILSAGAIKQRPYVVDGAVAAVNTLMLTVSMDHRVVDGAEAASFLSRIAELLENPFLLCAF